jgi:hypothetical protein
MGSGAGAVARLRRPAALLSRLARPDGAARSPGLDPELLPGSGWAGWTRFDRTRYFGSEIKTRPFRETKH